MNVKVEYQLENDSKLPALSALSLCLRISPLVSRLKISEKYNAWQNVKLHKNERFRRCDVGFSLAPNQMAIPCGAKGEGSTFTGRTLMPGVCLFWDRCTYAYKLVHAAHSNQISKRIFLLLLPVSSFENYSAQTSLGKCCSIFQKPISIFTYTKGF